MESHLFLWMLTRKKYIIITPGPNDTLKIFVTNTLFNYEYVNIQLHV